MAYISVLGEVSRGGGKIRVVLWGAQWLAYDAKKILTIEQIDYFNNLIFNELKMCEKSELIKQLIKNYKISRTYEPGRYDEIYYDKSCEILKNLVEVLSKDESY